MSEEVTRLKNAFYMVQNGNPVARNHKTPLDTLSPHSESKAARTYFSLFTRALDEAGLRSNSVDIRIPRTNDGRSFRGDPSKPLGLSIVFDLMSQPRPPKNPAGAALLQALGADPVHADQIRLNIKHVDGKFVRDNNDPDGFRYDGGSYITSLEIPFESAALNEVVAVLDRKVAERKDFEKRIENSQIGNYFASLSEDERYDMVSVIMAHKEKPSIVELLTPPPIEASTEDTQNIPGWLETLLSQLQTKSEPSGNNNTFSPA